MLEFLLVLRGRGRRPREVRDAVLALKKVLLDCAVTEVRTLDAFLLVLQCEIELKYGLSFFDSLIAASALAVDGKIISDDTAFDRVSGLGRIVLA